MGDLETRFGDGALQWTAGPNQSVFHPKFRAEDAGFLLVPVEGPRAGERVHGQDPAGQRHPSERPYGRFAREDHPARCSVGARGGCRIRCPADAAYAALSRSRQLTPGSRMLPGTPFARWTLTATLAVAGLFLAGCSPASREARFVHRGKSYLEKKDYARAVLEFHSAEQAMPNDAEPYYQEGLAYMGLGNHRSAFQAFTRATQLDPKHAAAQIKLTQLLSSSRVLQTLRRAEEHGKPALTLSPGHPDALNALALTEYKLGNEADASS